MNSSEFAKAIESMVSRPGHPPYVYSDLKRDYVEFLAAPDDYYAEYVDDHVTVFYSQVSREMIGSRISNIAELLRKFPGLYIEIHDSRVKIQHLLQCSVWATPEPATWPVIKHQKIKALIEVAERTDAQAELELA
jgi:hypothetical protein